MKNKTRSLFGIRHSAFPALLAALTLCFSGLSGRAQDDTVTISAAEFQRMVYSGHLLTTFFQKPELDASLRVLLELQRRNPQADPAALAGVSLQALAHYRSNAPACIRTSGWQDERLAAYLEAFNQVPGRTNFNPATLQLLNGFMLNRNTDTNFTASERIHSASQRTLASEKDLAQRRDLLETALQRAQANTAFRAALDTLLLPETGASLTDSPAQIVNANPVLRSNDALLALLTRAGYGGQVAAPKSAASLRVASAKSGGGGSLTMSMNELKDLFSGEMQTMQQTMDDNRRTHLEIAQKQNDTLAYLKDEAGRAADERTEAAAKEAHQQKVEAANASVDIISSLVGLIPGNDPWGVPYQKRAEQFKTVGTSVIKIADALNGWNQANGMMKVAASGNILAAGLAIYGLFGPEQPDPQQEILEGIGEIKTMIDGLRTEMHDRFDRVDLALNTIYTDLSDRLGLIQTDLNWVKTNVVTIRADLLQVQTQLNRIERQLFTDFNNAQRHDLEVSMDWALLRRDPMTYGQYSDQTGPETTFYSHAATFAGGTLSSPQEFSPAELAGSGLQQQLDLRPLDANLNYIKRFLSSTLGQSTDGTLPLSNPRDWFAGAYAYLQLAAENPMYYRAMQYRLGPIISDGDNVASFLRSLSVSGGGTTPNSSLYTNLLGYYAAKRASFLSQVHQVEQRNGFAMETWRPWDLAAPRITATNTELKTPPVVQPARLGTLRATQIAGGYRHSLALKADGTVAGWGAGTNNTGLGFHFGQAMIPTNATNAVAIAGGVLHSLALRADGTVVGWGDDRLSAANGALAGSNVVAIAAGWEHSLALQSNGTVIAWGNNAGGQTNVPAGLTNVTAISAGGYHCLALQSNGTVIGWGNTGIGPVPASLTNVVAIAAGGYHCLALRADRTVVGWGDNSWGQTNIPAGLTNVVAIAAGGGDWAGHSLALRADGTVVTWGNNSNGETNVPAGLSNVVAIAAGGYHSLALQSNGRIVAWGEKTYGQCTPPAPLNWITQIAAGGKHSLALKTDGTVVGWGWNDYGQRDLPSEINNVVAVAANLGMLLITGGSFPSGHSLALRADGTVFGFGQNQFGQATGMPNPASPFISAGTVTVGGQTLTGVVAIAAGWLHNLAMKADGSVVTWGHPNLPAAPAGLNGVRAIAAGGGHGLALKTNGTVVAWGDNSEGQTNLPMEARSGVLAIAAGYGHSLALKTNSTVVAWGHNDFGETNVPAGLSDVVTIAAGSYHNLALKADGTVVAWGYNGSGATNVPAGLTNVVTIAAGEFHSLALKADGTVVVWGANFFGQHDVPAAPTWRAWPGAIGSSCGALHNLALKDDGSVVAWGYNNLGQATVPPDARSQVVAVAAGGDENGGHSMVLKADGRVFAWGRRDQGQTNISGQQRVVGIAAGDLHSLALFADGHVGAWGYNGIGQCTVHPEAQSEVVAIAAGRVSSLALKANGRVLQWGGIGGSPPDNGVVAIAAGLGFGLALKEDGTVVGWGQNAPTIPAGLNNVVGIAAGNWHGLALKTDGSVVAWGNNAYGQTNVPPEARSGVVAITAGWSHSLALKADGTIVAWGDSQVGQTNVPAGMGDVVLMAAQGLNNPVAIAGGYYHGLALSAEGTVTAWGYNVAGECNVPPGLDNVMAIAGGGLHSLALKYDGTVVAWGGYGAGQCSVPPDLFSVGAIAAGGRHSLALRYDGSVVAWGENTAGQTNVPAGLSGGVAIAAGDQHNLALRGDGLVAAWGYDVHGQSTVPPEAQSEVVAIAAGRNHSLALKTNGSVLAWGDNTSGQRTVPPEALSGVVAIAASGDYSLALKTNGTVVGWGDNLYGQRDQLVGLSNVVAMAAGVTHAHFLTANTASGTVGTQPLPFVRANLPVLALARIRDAYANVLAELGPTGDLKNPADELSGAKALLTAVLELGLPYTLERDDLLRGCLYGSESLADVAVTTNFFQAESARLEATPDAPPVLLDKVVGDRFEVFTNRLWLRLNEVAASGQPEIPRLVGHTLRLLNLLRDAWTQPANSPPPALEIGRATNGLGLVLYGEPYAHYTLQYSDNLSVPGWTPTTMTNLHNEQIIMPPVFGTPQRYYRAVMPVP